MRALLAENAIHVVHDGMVPSETDAQNELADRTDAFLALPGGLASFDEVFALWRWGTEGWHDKPCGLLNTGDYYSTMLKTVSDELLDQFVKETQRGMLIVDRDAETLLRALADYRPPETRRFTDPEDESW